MFKLFLQSTRSSLRSLPTPLVSQKCSYRPRTIYQDDQEFEKPRYNQNYNNYNKSNYYNKYEDNGTFSPRDFQYDNSHGETGTLHTRFIKYIALENCKYDPLIPQKINQ
uniref:Uncharacterized protein n=1 Tax=Megaselia scalaris TaxID=36166 RepID=T1GWL0_MEGSC